MLYEVITTLRKRKRRTQDDVSVAINVPRPTYSGYENGVSVPGLRNNFV